MMPNKKLLRKQAEEINWIKGLLTSAQHRGWFGKITVEIKRGMIDLVRHEETLKPPKSEDI